MATKRTLGGTGKFLSDTRGMSSVEFTLVALVFFLFVFGIMDFGRALWEWNSAAKATQMAIRYAVVNDSVVEEIAAFSGLDLVPPIGSGDPIPANQFNGGNPVKCDVNGCDSGFTKNDLAFDAIVAELQRYYSRAQPGDVEVEYVHTGLGFSGNPFGTDIVPAVTVRLKPMQFDLITPLVSGLVSIPMPDFAATLTAEDLRS